MMDTPLRDMRHDVVLHTDWCAVVDMLFYPINAEFSSLTVPHYP
jgi:hypothetical protein